MGVFTMFYTYLDQKLIDLLICPPIVHWAKHNLHKNIEITKEKCM